MFKRIVLTALVAGALAGVFAWGLQLVTTTPLIAHAEQFENGANTEPQATDSDSDDGHSHDHGDAWMPHDGFERHAFTLLSSVLMSTGLGFMLTAVFALRGVNVDIRQGILWGLGGFAALYVAPALGLPPELPGMMGGDVTDRQLWWAACAIATAVGLGLLVFGERTALRVAGVIVMVVPHVVGAPHPNEFSTGLPAELVAKFAVSSLVTVGLFWMMLGGLTACFYEKFEHV